MCGNKNAVIENDKVSNLDNMENTFAANEVFYSVVDVTESKMRRSYCYSRFDRIKAIFVCANKNNAIDKILLISLSQLKKWKKVAVNDVLKNVIGGTESKTQRGYSYSRCDKIRAIFVYRSRNNEIDKISNLFIPTERMEKMVAASEVFINVMEITKSKMKRRYCYSRFDRIKAIFVSGSGSYEKCGYCKR